MLLFQLVFVNSLLVVEQSLGQMTEILKNNIFLSRQRRYLNFPKGSNLILTLSAVKSLNQAQPKGFNVLAECDIPFPLPSDTSVLTKRKHILEKRYIFSQLENAFNYLGLNGEACLQRIICESKNHRGFLENTMTAQLFEAIFSYLEMNLVAVENGQCKNATFYECSEPILEYLIGSILS